MSKLMLQQKHEIRLTKQMINKLKENGKNYIFYYFCFKFPSFYSMIFFYKCDIKLKQSDSGVSLFG